MAASKRTTILFLVTGAGVGYFPRAPGTAATLITIPLSLGLNRLAESSMGLAVLIVVASVVSAIWLSSRGAEILGQKDPQIIVIDEIVGFLIANFLSRPDYLSLVLAFILFRFFDITKLFFIAKLEALPGGTGIVLDDVMAGLYTFIMLRLAAWYGWL